MNIPPPWSIILRVFKVFVVAWSITLIFALTVSDVWIATKPWWVVSWAITLGLLSGYVGYVDLTMNFASFYPMESPDMERLRMDTLKKRRNRAIAAFTGYIGLSLGVMWLTGCSPMHVEVDPTAKARVKVLAVESQVGADCDYLGGMTAAFNAPLVSFEENVKNAQNDLINRAAESGATHLLLGEPRVDLGGSFVMDECIHCVVQDAKAFLCK